MSEEAKGDATIDEMELADHIIKWMDILTKGPQTFKKALCKERRRMNPTPIVFAIMEPSFNKVQLARGFEDSGGQQGTRRKRECGFFLGQLSYRRHGQCPNATRPAVLDCHKI
jgi:hypothetical protein